MDRVVTFLLVGMWLTSLGCDASNDLDSVKPDDEDGGDLILPCLREVSRRFGAPAAAMRDLGKAMIPALDALVAELELLIPARGPAQDTREAIDVILAHMKDHGKNLFGHAICLPESAGGGVRLVARTNVMAESFFKMLKHDERRRSGRKNLGQDLEHLHAEAALVRNLEHDDYMRIVCGSLDRLPAAFAKLDQLERENKLNCKPTADQEDDLKTILQLASASLSPADRRVVRDEKMDRRIEAAARASAPRR